MLHRVVQGRFPIGVRPAGVHPRCQQVDHDLHVTGRRRLVQGRCQRNRIPKAHGAVQTSTGQDTPVRTERYSMDCNPVTLKGMAQSTRPNPPQTYGAVIATAGQDVSVRTKSHAVDPVRVALQGVRNPTKPHMHGTVFVGMGHGPSIWTKGHAADLVCTVTKQGKLQFTRLWIPPPHSALVAAADADQGLAVWSESHAVDCIRVAVNVVPRGTQSRIP